MRTVLFAIATFTLAMVLSPVPAAYAAGTDLSGTIKTSNDTDICAMVLASGQFMFSCNPDGVFSLAGLPGEQDGTVKRQIYADGFFPKIDTLTGSSNDAVTMARSGVCPKYNPSYNSGFFPNSAFKRIDIAGKVLQQDSQTPLCAMVLANGQHMFSCDGSGTYAMNIQLDNNGQFKLQVYADGFAPTIQTFDEFKATNDVRMARASECQLPTSLNVVLLGYWPPTNEMLRKWSTNPLQNPGGWKGENWEGYGFNVYSYFPEFPPDGDPSNDPIGSLGSVGSADSDLRVDYQDTSADFWRIMDTYQPTILITTSRGGGIGWEIEAIEGGHGLSNNSSDPSLDWSSDRFGVDVLPTQASVDPRSWAAISQYRRGNTLPSQLPMNEILIATSALGLTSVQIDQNGTSGNYLSGFLGLHGLAYNLTAAHNVAAGHIHVDGNVPVASAEQLIETTLRVVLDRYSAGALPSGP